MDHRTALENVLALAKIHTESAAYEPADVDEVKLHEQALDTVEAMLNQIDQSDPRSVAAMARDALDEQALGHVELTLALSTAHVTEQSGKFLTACAEVPGGAALLVYEKPQGWWLLVHEQGDVPSSVPDDVRAVLDYARSLSCCWVLLDNAADQVDDLPAYEW